MIQAECFMVTFHETIPCSSTQFVALVARVAARVQRRPYLENATSSDEQIPGPKVVVNNSQSQIFNTEMVNSHILYACSNVFPFNGYSHSSQESLL